jgi:RHS repeat-associated protein
MNKLSSLLILLSLWLGLSTLAHASTVTYVYTDPQGTPLAEADASGNITARFDYAPYGTAVANMSPAPNGPGYTGHVNDPDSGLVYMQARYYDPAVGRFLSVDPAAPMPGNEFNFSRYAYANNNPIGNTDPTGMDDCGPGCMKMRALSDWFSGVGQRLMSSLGQQSATAPMAQMSVMNTYITGSADNDLATASAEAAPMADAIPGVTLGACLTGSNCSGTDWAMGSLSVAPGEGAEADVAREAYPYIMAGMHGNSAASTVTSYLYRLTSSATGNLLKWGISKNPFGRYTRGFMLDKDMQIMTSGSRREMLNLERWTVEHDPGPLNREPWAGKQAGNVP